MPLGTSLEVLPREAQREARTGLQVASTDGVQSTSHFPKDADGRACSSQILRGGVGSAQIGLREPRALCGFSLAGAGLKLCSEAEGTQLWAGTERAPACSRDICQAFPSSGACVDPSV